ncbi:MAG: leucine-rich repeat protein [Lachnospiraceae bacterium]|nr:leucine-rich repeat protein [Lachnospiraceae bacterium]
MGKRTVWMKKASAIAMAFTMVVAEMPFTTTIAQAKEKEIVLEAVEVDAGGNYELMNQVQGSSILHCWNWSYKTIEEHMELIAQCGYTAIQTSPATQPKDYTYEGNVASEMGYPGLHGKGNWWKVYPPVTFSVCDNGQTWFGTKAELESMCATAEKYGIKVIVDIVANHMGNISGWQNALSDISPQVGEYWDPNMMTDESFWHINDLQVWQSDGREHFTQGTMGMPDLNTADKRVQKYQYEYLKELIDCGVDGFRFDAAKHIETPDDGSFASDFWPTVLGEARSHYTKKNGGDLYVYGEILNTVGDNFSIDSYTKYMSVTDNSAGHHLLETFRNGQVGSPGLHYAADKAVLWAESHDTYMNESSRYASDRSIVRTWAMIANKKDATALFFVRPYYSKDVLKDDTDGSEKGDLGNNLAPAIMGDCETYVWASKEVAAINHFNNRMATSAESYGADGNVAYCKRGDGIVLASLNGAGSVSVGCQGLSDGSYTDEVSGGTFTVSGGKVSGTIEGEYGIAVLYKNVQENPGTVYPVNIRSSIDNGSNYYTDTIGLTLTAKYADSATYEASSGEKGTFTDSTRIHVGAGVAIGDSVTVKVTGTNASGTYEETFTYYKQDVDIDQCVFFKNSKNWVRANAYAFYEDASKKVTAKISGWPGVKMFEYEETEDGTMIYAVEIPEIDTYNNVIFNNNIAEIQTTLGSYGQIFDPATGSWSKYMEPGSGKAKVKASLESATIVGEKEVTFTVTNADSATYSLNGGKETAFTDSVTVKVGTDLEEGKSDTVTIIAKKGDKVTEKTYTYTMGENKPILSVSPGIGTTFTDVLDVEITAENAVEATYTINNGEAKSFTETEKITVGKDSQPGDIVEITVYGKSSNGKETTETVVYAKTKVIENNYIYFKNTGNWTNVYAYVWSSKTETSMEKWPGTAMTVYDEAEKIYALDLGTENAYDSVIFSNQGASQTGDLSIGKLGQLYDGTGWSDYHVTKAPTISATLESGKVKEATKVTYTVKDAEGAIYKIGSAKEEAFKDEVTITVGEGLANGEKQNVIIKAENGDQIAVKIYSYEMKSETSVTPTVKPTISPMVSETPNVDTTPVVSGTPELSVSPNVSESPDVMITPGVTGGVDVKPTTSPIVNKTPEPIVSPGISDSPMVTPEVTNPPIYGIEDEETPLAKGEVFNDENTGVSYRVTKVTGQDATVAYVGSKEGVKGTVTIPETVTLDEVTYTVTSIASNAFKGNKKITKVVIGKTITTIGKNAFSGCSKLKTIKIGANVKTIGDGAFYKCSSLTKVTIPAKVKKVGKNAFSGCKKLKTITIKTKLLTKKNVGSKAFQGIYAKATIQVPKSKLKSYKAMLKAKGIGKKVKIKNN